MILVWILRSHVMKKSINWRTIIVLVFICLFGAAIISRLFFLQILEKKRYQAQALGQQVGFSSVTGPRGQIFSESSQETKGKLNSGEIRVLAMNRDSWSIAADSNIIEDKLFFAKELSGVLDIEEEKILLELERDSSYIILAKDLPIAELDKIKKLNLKGLFWQNESKRFYPQGRLAAQVIGFLGGGGTGQYGLEGYYEDILKGKFGVVEEKKGLELIFFNNKSQSLDGSDIYLTLDYNIQFQAESLLRKAAENIGIESGQIIVMKPDSGRIIALANFPSFNLNQYGKEEKIEIFQNSAIQKIFEPGSIMKPFTMAMGLNEGKITPETTFVDPGYIIFGKYKINNFANKQFGEVTMTQVLEKSINTGAVYVSQLISRSTQLEYIDKFGFTKKTNIDLQGEVSSTNKKLRNAVSAVDFATASFGQGIEMTPIQIATGFSAIANGGRLVRPYIVDKVTNKGREIVTKPEIFDKIISEKTSSQLSKMLTSVIEKGFGNGAKIPGYYLAGKTGTAQVPLTRGRGYDKNKTIQTFLGYGPSFNPQFLILVKLDNPKVSQSSLSAVPMFKELAQYIINYWKIPPDYNPDDESENIFNDKED